MEIECQKRYHTNGNLYREIYSLQGVYHRENGPAIIYYFPSNGKISEEYYYKNGYCTREDGPAYIAYCYNGQIAREEYRLNGQSYYNEDIINNWKDFCKMQIFR